MVKSKMSKSESIRQHMAEHKDATVPEIAKALGVQPGLVYQVKSKGASGKSKKKTEKQKAGPAAQVTGLVDLIEAAQVIAAANLIKSCGSGELARQALKAAEKVAKALD